MENDVLILSEAVLPELRTETNTNYTNSWCHNTIEKTILYGTKLRKTKQKVLPEISASLHKSELTRLHSHLKVKRKHKKQADIKKKTCQLIYNRPRESRCPMRIVELAVPSKRQCIETWRKYYHILPSFMLEKLKQHITDEKPIVHVEDAINCFMKRKASAINRSRKKVKTKLKNSNIQQTLILCANFSGKVARKLMLQRTTSFSHLHDLHDPRLEKLAQVVADDIVYIRRTTLNQTKKNKNNKKILEDISKQVATWIASVLEDSLYRLLMQDLLDFNEEEEDHIQDIIEDLFEYVVNNCDLRSEDSDENCDHIIYIDKGRNENKTNDSADNVSDSLHKKHIEIEILEEEKSETSSYKLETNTTPEPIRLNAIPINNISDKDKILIKNDINNIINKVLINLKNEYLKNFESNRTNQFIFSLLEDGILTHFDNSNDINIDKNTEVYERNIVKSDHKEINRDLTILDESIPDERNVKVKFSTISTGPGEKIISGSQFSSSEAEQLSVKLSTSNLKNYLVFGPPNEYLLSDADESWPDNIKIPLIKASSSVTRSISSLGNILEYDEKTENSPL